MVAVSQSMATPDPLPVQERAVARQPVIDDGPVALDPLELRVQPGHFLIPGEDKVVVVAPPDGELLAGQLDQRLMTVAIAVDDERRPSPFGLDARLQLSGGGPVPVEGRWGTHPASGRATRPVPGWSAYAAAIPSATAPISSRRPRTSSASRS